MITHMTEQEITAHIFVGCNERRKVSLRKQRPGSKRGFTDCEILALPSSPHFAQFTPIFRSWVWATIAEIAEEEGPKALSEINSL